MTDVSAPPVDLAEIERLVKRLQKASYHEAHVEQDRLASHENKLTEVEKTNVIRTALLTAIRQLASAPVAVPVGRPAILPLVWESDDWRNHRAENAIVVISINRLGQERDAWRASFGSWPWPRHWEPFDTVEEAKAWASEQYFRLMSQVVAPATSYAEDARQLARTAPASDEKGLADVRN